MIKPVSSFKQNVTLRQNNQDYKKNNNIPFKALVPVVGDDYFVRAIASLSGFGETEYILHGTDMLDFTPRFLREPNVRPDLTKFAKMGKRIYLFLSDWNLHHADFKYLGNSGDISTFPIASVKRPAMIVDSNMESVNDTAYDLSKLKDVIDDML